MRYRHKTQTDHSLLLTELKTLSLIKTQYFSCPLQQHHHHQQQQLTTKYKLTKENNNKTFRIT